MHPQQPTDGWFQRLRRNLFPPAHAPVASMAVSPPTPPPPFPNTPERFRARGRVPQFSFTVTLAYNWEADTVNRQGWATHLQPIAREKLQKTVREIARGIAPHRPDLLEDLANERFAKVNEYQHEDIRIGYHPRVSVAPDDRVKQHLEAYWERRVALHCLHDLDRLRAEVADDLVARWLTTLRGLLADPLARHASKLVEKELFAAASTRDGSGRKDFAAVVSEVFDGQAKEGRDLVNLLQKAIRDHDSIGLGHYEFVQTYDEALSRLQPQHPAVPTPNGREQ